MSLASGHHDVDPPSTSDPMVKSQKGKVRNPCLLCKDMHFTHLCPLMDEASKLLEDITVSHQWLPTGYRKLSLEPPLVDKVVDPTLLLKSEIEVVNPSPSLVDPTLPLKGEVKVADSVSSAVNPTLPSKSEFEAVDLSPSLVDPNLPLESEVKLVESMLSPPDPTLSLESLRLK